jgi:RNA polymerase sigma-70 factor, ECF subfamily
LAWQDVRGAISRLTQGEQQVVFLRYWSDKSDAQIASMLEIPVGTVKIRLHRARDKLARAVVDA